MKTGTTSLGAAFRILGYRSCSWHPRAAASFKKSNDFSVLKKYLDKYDAFDDGPWHDCRFEDLDHHYPNSKFIILEREDGGWIRSMEKHQSPEFNINNIPPQYLRDAWLTDKDSHIAELLAWKNEKYKKIRHYFKDRPEDLLAFDIRTGWEPLCTFLDKPVPSQPFPEKNVSREFSLGNLLRFGNRFRK